jgi:hypothetical protein
MERDEQSMGAANMPPFGGDVGGGAAGETREPVEPRAPRAAGGTGRAQQRINRGMRDAADRLESAAGRLEQAIGQRSGAASGPMARAGELGQSVAGGMGSVAGYLRGNDVDSVREELERRIRDRPLQSLLIGVAAGWLVGKILR